MGIPELMLLGQLGAATLGISKTQDAASLQKQQLENERLRMEIAASEASQQRLNQTAQIIASNQAAQAAAGLAPGTNQAVMTDEYQVALDDIDAIEFNLQSQVAENEIAQHEVQGRADAASLGMALNTSSSMFDTLRLS